MYDRPAPLLLKDKRSARAKRRNGAPVALLYTILLQYNTTVQYFAVTMFYLKVLCFALCFLVCAGKVACITIQANRAHIVRAQVRAVLIIRRYTLTMSIGQLTITGNEEPLIIGLSRHINCTWLGEENVTMMEWFVVGLEAVAIETETNAKSVILTLDPNSDGLDGAMFTCRATLFNNSEIDKTIQLSVEGRFINFTCTVLSSIA